MMPWWILPVLIVVNLKAEITINPTAPPMNNAFVAYFNVLYLSSLFWSLLEPIGSLPP